MKTVKTKHAGRDKASKRQKTPDSDLTMTFTYHKIKFDIIFSPTPEVRKTRSGSRFHNCYFN